MDLIAQKIRDCLSQERWTWPTNYFLRIKHDDGGACVPGGFAGNYIMYASATKGTLRNNDKFSPCSIRNISDVLVPFFSGETNRENCFQKNSGPICGNEIREGDEECDCGLDESECHDKCCHPRRSAPGHKGCTLKDPAVCR